MYDKPIFEIQHIKMLNIIFKMNTFRDIDYFPSVMRYIISSFFSQWIYNLIVQSLKITITMGTIFNTSKII